MAGFVGASYERMKADRHIGFAMAPTGGATGVANIFAPTEAELENGGGRGFVNAAKAVSWNDFGFGVQASETNADPSLADDSTYEDFGQVNYGGSVSLFYPHKYDDATNIYSVVYDLTDEPWTKLDVAMRVDGNKSNTTDLVDGDFVHVARTLTDGEANEVSGSDALRRTVNFLHQGGVAPYTIVGDHTITAVEPDTDPWEEGKKARIRGIVQDRDYTSALSFSSDDPEVVLVYPGGFYEIVGDSGDSATITITDEGAGTSTTVAVTVTA